MRVVALVAFAALAWLAPGPKQAAGAPPTGAEPGWRTLGPADFVRVNDTPDTWTWRGDLLVSTGVPIGVLRTAQSFTSVELLIEWRHLQPGGNSGVFLWVPESALRGLAPGMLPDLGIEIQMLDHAFREQYEARTGRKGDWFTTHGDVFAVGQSKLTPFAPRSPNGLRSFPKKSLSRGAGEWNQYYVRAIAGEVRLWVNGEEVSGGQDANPREGYLCLEAEGAPIEFRHIRVR